MCGWKYELEKGEADSQSEARERWFCPLLAVLILIMICEL